MLWYMLYFALQCPVNGTEAFEGQNIASYYVSPDSPPDIKPATAYTSLHTEGPKIHHMEYRASCIQIVATHDSILYKPCEDNLRVRYSAMPRDRPQVTFKPSLTVLVVLVVSVH